MWKKNPADDKPELPITSSSSNGKEQALIGPSIRITGGLAGEEDVIIQGTVDGTVEFKQHNVTVGKHGRITADIYAKEICVEGNLEGDLYGEKRVSVRATGRVKGNITAPRVVMEDGAKFKGSIDMDAKSVSNETNEHKQKMTNLPPIAEKLRENVKPNMDKKLHVGNQKP
ncbi:MAG: polymer-forming cytoskeletal protein [Gammaproteobacteria bacterium]|nr:polymer-forming cytoskeletal protein [Gammaproteobacteria bacterium]MDH5731574.1 polymer-forming cytoskeletal protein [Gammaproteobacteria bacterium]